jgi:hypothetical protein
MFGLDGYVHLCFRGNHPMEHIATVEGRIQRSVVSAGIRRTQFRRVKVNPPAPELCGVQQELLGPYRGDGSSRL